MEVVSIDSRRARRIQLIILAIVVYGFLSVFFSPLELYRRLNPDSSFFTDDDSACIFLNMTGYPCMFCGMSRSLISLMKLDFAGVFYYNPLAFLVYSAGGLITVLVLVLSFFNKAIKINNVKRLWLSIGVVLLIVWVINILFGHH